jgi:hypothetical protein
VSVACAVAVGNDAVDAAMAGLAVGGTAVAVGGACVAVGGFVGVFSTTVGTLVGDGSAVTCIQPETRTAPEKPVLTLTASRASALDGMTALAVSNTPSASVAAMK